MRCSSASAPIRPPSSAAGWAAATCCCSCVLGTLVAGIFGLVVGLFVVRYREIFFGMLNLAFSMVLWSLLEKLYPLHQRHRRHPRRAADLLGMSFSPARIRMRCCSTSRSRWRVLATSWCSAISPRPLGHMLRAIKIERDAARISRRLGAARAARRLCALGAARRRRRRAGRGGAADRDAGVRLLDQVRRVRLHRDPRRRRPRARRVPRRGRVRVRARLCRGRAGEYLAAHPRRGADRDHPVRAERPRRAVSRDAAQREGPADGR